MMSHDTTPAAALFTVLAQATVPQFSWTQTLLVYGPLGLWVAWFVIRDKLDREERKSEREDNERRHKENLAAQKRIEDAFRSNTTALMVAVGSMKSSDAAYVEMASRVKDDNLDQK